MLDKMVKTKSSPVTKTEIST